MALVNFLKFSADSGAIISDEEYWNVFFRKRMHGDNLHTLLDSETAEILGMQVVYGSVGYPSLHREVVTGTQQAVAHRVKTQGKDAFPRLKDIARLAFELLQKGIRRRIDQKMQFYYGFKTDDLNRGSYTDGGETIPIKTEKIRKAAGKLAQREQTDTLLKDVLAAKAAVFGYDADGITGYYLAGENSILGYVHEGFEAIGTGKYASGMVFGKDFKAKTLMMRQAGYDPAEGLLELIHSATLAGDHFKEVGGNYNFMVLNRAAKRPEDRIQTVFDDEARLASEIVNAFRAEILSRKDAVACLRSLVFEAKPLQKVEKVLFEKVTDPRMLHYLLRRYKLRDIEEIVRDTGKKPSRKGGRS